MKNDTAKILFNLSFIMVFICLFAIIFLVYFANINDNLKTPQTYLLLNWLIVLLTLFAGITLITADSITEL